MTGFFQHRSTAATIACSACVSLSCRHPAIAEPPTNTTSAAAATPTASRLASRRLCWVCFRTSHCWHSSRSFRPFFPDDRREVGDGLRLWLNDRSPRLNLGERRFVPARHPRRHVASRILRAPEGAFGLRLRFLHPQPGLLFANALPRFARRLRFDCGPVNRGQPRFGEPAAKPRPRQPDAGPCSLNGKLVVTLEQPPEERRSERRPRHHREQALVMARPSPLALPFRDRRRFRALRAHPSASTLPKGANASSIRPNHVRTACRSNDNGFASSRSPSANALRLTISLTLPWSR
jgi:hypothetical protein